MTRARVGPWVLAAVVLAAATGCDWSQSRYDFGAAGANPTERGVTPDGPAQLQPVWTYAFTTSGSPVTGGGRVYVPGRPSGSTERRLYAVRESDGATLWSVPCDQGFWEAWAHAAGTVFAACGSTVHALDAATGALRWQRPHPGSSPRVSLAGDGLVVVAGTATGTTVARLGLDGTERWSLAFDGAVTVRGDGSRLWVERADGTLAAHRLDDGSLVGEMPDVPGSLRAVAAGRLFFVQEGDVDGNLSYEVRLRAVDGESGAQLWEHLQWCPGGQHAAMQIAVDAGTVAFSTDSRVNRSTCVYGAVDVETGAGRWNVFAQNRTWGAVPTIADGAAYFYRGVDLSTSDGGAFAVLRLADGEVLRDERVATATGASVVVANGRVLLPQGAFAWVPSPG